LIGKVKIKLLQFVVKHINNYIAKRWEVRDKLKSTCINRTVYSRQRHFIKTSLFNKDNLLHVYNVHKFLDGVVW